MMGGLGPLLASVMAFDISAMRRKITRNAILYGIALAFFWTAYGLAVAALAIYLGELWGLPIALLVVAAGFLVLAVIMLIAVMIANAIDERRKREAAAANSARTLAVTAALSAFPMVMKSRGLILASAAAGIGFLLMRGMGGGGGDDQA